MSFAYNDYLYQNFWAPICFTAFLGIIFAAFLLSLLGKTSSHKKDSYKTPGKRFAAGLLALASFGILFYINLSALIPRGIELYRDRNALPDEYCGTIEEVIPSAVYTTRYETPEGTSFGVTMTIDGTSFHAMTSAGFSAGDSVRVLYLPCSHCVLEIYGAN